MKTYPKHITVNYYKENVTPQNFNIQYQEFKTVNNMNEESDFYCSLNHESNITITVS